MCGQDVGLSPLGCHCPRRKDGWSPPLWEVYWHLVRTLRQLLGQSDSLTLNSSRVASHAFFQGPRYSPVLGEPSPRPCGREGYMPDSST